MRTAQTRPIAGKSYHAFRIPLAARSPAPSWIVSPLWATEQNVRAVCPFGVIDQQRSKCGRCACVQRSGNKPPHSLSFEHDWHSEDPPC